LTQYPDDHIAASRGRSVLHASAAGAVFQGIYALSQFVILAVLLRYIGAERFGMWTTVWSIGAWAMITHFGINHALLTELGRCAMTDRDRAGRVLTTAVLGVGTLTVVLVALAVLVGGWLPWSAILNVQDSQAVREAAPVTVVALAMALAGVPLSIGGAALLAVQRGGASYLAQTAAHILCVVAVVIGVRNEQPLTTLTVYAFSPPILAGVMQWLLLLRGPAAVRLGRWDAGIARGLFAAGAVFFIMELLGIAMMQTGPLIIAQCLGAQAVTPYAGMFRLIGLLLAIYSVIMLAYWPAFADAGQQGDHHWFGRAMRWSFNKTLGVWLLGAAGIYLFGDAFIHWWLGPEAMPTTSLKIWMIVFVGLQGVFLWLTTPLKGLGRLRVQIISGAAMTCLFIPLAVWLCGDYGAAGIPIAQSIVILLIGLPFNAFALRRAVVDLPQSGGTRGDVA
jgi:O-antigen/teichoic acid export membrane protein